MKYIGIHKKIARILLPVFALAMILVLFVHEYYQSKINLIQHSDGKPSTEGTVNNTDSDVLSQNSDMKDRLDGLEEKPSVDATGDIFSDKDIFNILLIGTDERGSTFSDNARGDTCLLLSLNQKDGSLCLVSFERGMGVPILDGRYKGQYDWLTHTFQYGGADLMMREIRECFKIEVDYYIRVNFTTFKQGIDSVGGVDITLTQAEADYINAQYPRGFRAGTYHLDGDTALCYARCRKIDSDWKRIVRQRTVIQAAMDQLKGLSLTELDRALNELLPLIQTNLPSDKITQLLLAAPKFQGKTAKQLTIPVSGTYGGMIGMGGRSLFSVDFEANSKILQEFISSGT